MVVIALSSFAANNFGRFIGAVHAEWLDDGRKMRLLKPFAYVSLTELPCAE